MPRGLGHFVIEDKQAKKKINSQCAEAVRARSQYGALPWGSQRLGCFAQGAPGAKKEMHAAGCAE